MIIGVKIEGDGWYYLLWFKIGEFKWDLWGKIVE